MLGGRERRRQERGREERRGAERKTKEGRGGEGGRKRGEEENEMQEGAEGMMVGDPRE